MRASLWMLIGGGLAIGTAHGEVEPATVRIPQSKAWVGQRVPLYVELRAPGPFAGSATFDLPSIPRVLLMKIGNPVVSSQELDGSSWFVQTHEFALFSQQAGILEVPSISVRFARREGFAGEAKELHAQTRAFRLDIERPPGSEQVGFLLTAESLEITETWDPQPGPSQVGALFKRTIVQRAQEIPGMVLAPAPTNASAGIRVYPAQAQTNDRLDRGDFLGERRETISYLMQAPGTLSLPALAYVWWNPKTKTLESKTLPGVTIEVAPPPPPPAAKTVAVARRTWFWLLPAPLALALGMWKWRYLHQSALLCWSALDPPHRLAERKLRRACRQNNAPAAQAAWTAWRTLQDPSFQPAPELSAAVLELQRHLFGPPTIATWRGITLSSAFARSIAPSQTRSNAPSALPDLNPHAYN